MNKLKWILAAFIVIWNEPQLPKIIQCPNSQPMVDQHDGTQYVSACLASQDKVQQREFKTKKEADTFGNALKVLGILQVNVQEKK